MMGLLWVVLFVALTGTHCGYGLPVRPTPETYPHESSTLHEGWGSAVYAAVPALALVVTAVGLLFGCTWCYRHKDCKPNEGADNQLFTASATHLHDNRRANPPDSGFSEPANNNISEDNNNGPISLREMQNIANNNAAAYIVSENEERNRVSRESVVEFEPLPSGIRVADPLEHCADWFGGEDFTRNRLQYLREIGRGWFGRVVEGEVENDGATSTVAVKILNQNASLEDKARFLDESRLYRDVSHENVLGFVAKCLQEDPWILIFELCSMDLQQYLVVNRPKMAILNESGVPLRLMCDVTTGLAHLHARGILYGNVWSGAVLVRGSVENARAVLGQYTAAEAPQEFVAPEMRRHGALHTMSSEVFGLGVVMWEVCAWGASPPQQQPPPLPDLPCPYRNHLYQLMQLCWSEAEARPSSPQVLALLRHLLASHSRTDNYGTTHFEERWQGLKPNTIPKVDEHVAIVHAPSTSIASTFTSEHDLEPRDTLSIDMDTAVSRSSSIMSDKDPLSIQLKSESLTNLHGSLEDVRNIYLTHNEMAVLECHQGNISLEDAREKEQDRSDSSVDPWLKDIIAGSQDDVSYYRDVSDVIKNLDNILNSEKTSSSESSHQASPSRDNLSLDCKKDYQMLTSMVKSPGITNFQNILESGFGMPEEHAPGEEEDGDRDTIGTLSHSFERHSDTTSQHTLENLTPDTPIKDLDVACKIESLSESIATDREENVFDKPLQHDDELPKEIAVVSSDSEIPNLTQLCVASMSSVSESNEQSNVRKDCQTSCDNNITEVRTDIKDETKSIDDIGIPKDDCAILEQIVKESVINLNQVPLRVEEVILPDRIEDSAVTSESEFVLPDDRKKPLEENQINEVKPIEEVKDFVVNLIETENNENLNNDLINQSYDIKNGINHEEIKPEDNIPSFEPTECNEVTVQITEKSPEIVQIKHFEIISDDTNKVVDTPEKVLNIAEGHMPTLPPDTVQIIGKVPDIPVTETLDTAKSKVLAVTELSNIELKIEEMISQTERDLPEAVNRVTEQEDKEEVSSSIVSVNEEDLLIPVTEMEPASVEVQNMDLYSEMPIVSCEAVDITGVDKNMSDFKTEVFDAVKENEVQATKELILDETVDSEIILQPDVIEALNDETTCANELLSGAISKEITFGEAVNENELKAEMDCKVNNVEELFGSELGTEELRDEDHLDLVKNTVDENIDDINIGLKLQEVDNSPINLTEEIRNQETTEAVKNEELRNEEVTLENNITFRSENDPIETISQSNDTTESTVYMDLINDTNSQMLNLGNTDVDHDIKEATQSPLLQTSPNVNEFSLLNNDSTVYLDLPSSITVIQQTDNFLQMERSVTDNSNNFGEIVCSTPKVSDSSNVDVTLEKSFREDEMELLSETKIPDEPAKEETLMKHETKYVHDSLSPFDSPTKSHHTDTYDENSSVVLGPFEHCSLELYRGNKQCADLVELPKEELLAFSSNFSEINLETPSPLRDGNFLNEVPDIMQDDLNFDDIAVISESKPEQSDPSNEISDATEDQSATEKHVSPSTPPNSPGIFLASTSQQLYLVDIDMNHPVQSAPEPDPQNEIDLNQIQLQITSKLAMAENENNLNIEYSGPLTVEGVVEDEEMMRDSDAIPESYLAGNGGSVEDLREGFTLDEECVKALRNELELKLPLAQVAAIEPQCEAEWGGELPPPPELVVSYPAALSPIAEETRQQLSAYENDVNWNPSTRTDSSESYPEPCNNSTDEVTDLPTAAHSAHEHSTFTIQSPKSHSPHTQSPKTHSPNTQSPRTHSPNNTYTVQKDIASSKEITMSADSLNASPYKRPRNENECAIDDRTYNKSDEDKVPNCERISQESPFLLSPTTDSSAPDHSDNFDNATGVSTLSKTTLPTDAKHSKPSETQCLSKATSIDSWCSNDTLYNVEENFDDLAMDPDGLIDFEPQEKEEVSESTDTLTHQDDEKELSHCSTYIVHDSKSEVCETFSPDSITVNDNYTYTKVKTEPVATTPSVTIKSDENDSTKNSQTKDLAYGTLMSGVPSFSNCTTEVASAVDDVWKIQQPELIRKSPVPYEINMTPPILSDSKECLENASPQLTSEPCVKKMDSVDMSCLEDNSVESNKSTKDDANEAEVEIVNSPENNYKKNMAPSVTSTPLTELLPDTDNVVAIPMNLPEIKTDNSYGLSVPNFLSFQQSAEVRPQDLSSDVSNGCDNQDTEILLEGDTKLLSTISNREGTIALERTPTYSDFENSATNKPQEKSSQSVESGVSSEDFNQFQKSVRDRPQDLSSLIYASCLLLQNERLSSELAMSSVNTNDPTNVYLSPPNISNLIESHVANVSSPADLFLVNFGEEEETEQPHSIIITESTMDAFKESPNKTYDSHMEGKFNKDLNYTYDSHAGSVPKNNQSLEFNADTKHIQINGDDEPVNFIGINETKAPVCETTNEVIVIPQASNVRNAVKFDLTPETSNGAFALEDTAEVKCNGGSEKYATVNFLNETFEELIESNVDDSEVKDLKEHEEGNSEGKIPDVKNTTTLEKTLESLKDASVDDIVPEVSAVTNGVTDVQDGKVTVVTEDFLQNEKKFCQLDSYYPLLSDIRFTGPATEIMSTSFNQDSPTEPTSPECEQDSKPNTAAEILKEWDSDSDSHSSNSSSGEFIWKDGGGHETSVVPSTRFEHQRGGGPPGGGSEGGGPQEGAGSEGSGSSGSGSEGDEVEFVPSSWDCRAAPSKSSLRSLEAQPDGKKRVVFKRQKYHCVYEYPREVADVDAHSPYLPDLSTYSDWDPTSAEEAEMGYGQLFGAPSPLDLYPLRAGIAFGADYDEDFFISSSARPFESLGIMSTTSQFFPGMHLKRPLLERDLSEDVPEDFPPPPSPLPSTTLVTRTPSLDFTTPDSGVEDITPGSTTDDEFKAKKLPEAELTWRPVDSASSSESVSPSSPGGEALGGLRHTRDKLKLDLPPSPHIPSPRHNRVFNFVLDKPKRRSTDERPVELGTTPIVMTDETPVVSSSLPLLKDCDDLPVPEPTFSTFGKSVQKVEPEPKIVLTDEVEDEAKEESSKVVEAVKGEGTVLDSGDEDSGIESSSKATLERNKTPNVS